ncbi:MAG: glycosyl hydrolase family 28-related protein [Oscillospiraceae bacterium]
MQANMKSILDFGAVGDGITDDTTALKRAAESGETVFFPAGTYILSEEIHLSRVDIHWYGVGDLSVIKLMPADTSRPKKYQGKKVFKTSILFIEDGGELEFHNLKFDANKDAFDNDILQNGSSCFDHTVCIEVYGTKRLVLDGVTITNALIEGVYVYHTQYISITQSKFIDNGYCRKNCRDASGIQIGGGYKRPPVITISDSEFSNNGFNGLLLNGVYGAVVSNIACHNNGYDGVALWGGSSHCVFSNVFCSKNRAGLNVRRSSGPGYDEIAKNENGTVNEKEALYRYTSNIIVNGLMTVENRFGILWGCAQNIYVNGWIGDDTFNHGLVYLEEDEDITGYITGAHLIPAEADCEEDKSDISKFKVKYN